MVKPSRTPKVKAGRKAAEKGGKKRVDCVCDVLKKLPSTGSTFEDVAQRADRMYKEAGGDSNIRQTRHLLQVILPVVLNLGFATVKEDKLIPAT